MEPFQVGFLQYLEPGRVTRIGFRCFFSGEIFTIGRRLVKEQEILKHRPVLPAQHARLHFTWLQCGELFLGSETPRPGLVHGKGIHVDETESAGGGVLLAIVRLSVALDGEVGARKSGQELFFEMGERRVGRRDKVGGKIQSEQLIVEDLEVKNQKVHVIELSWWRKILVTQIERGIILNLR